VKTTIPQFRPSVSTYGLLAFAVALLAALLAPARSPAAIGDLTYVGCIANRSANGCEQAAHNSLDGADAVAVSRDGESVYVASNDAITRFKRHSSGALAYKGCIADRGAHGCEKARHSSLYDVVDLAVSRDGRSVYGVALLGNSITRFKRHSNGALAYKGCFANRGAHGCKKPPHNSLGYASGVVISRDGESVYVASADAITRFKRHSNGVLRYGGCFANGGAHGCRRPRHDSLWGSSGVAVSPDGKSLYVASTTGVTAFRRSANGALAYRGCFANQGHHGCQAGTHNSLRKSRDLAVSADGKSLYVASAGAITAFGRAPNGHLAYQGCIANRGTLGCEAPVHDSLRFPNDLTVSRDGSSVYVASIVANSITAFTRASDGTLTYGDCFANQGGRGCELPGHDSLGYAHGVAVTRDGRSVYVAADKGKSITLFSREVSGP
jgi:DNA-binding beta-propeller fold protein YncE